MVLFVYLNERTKMKPFKVQEEDEEEATVSRVAAAGEISWFYSSGGFIKDRWHFSIKKKNNVVSLHSQLAVARVYLAHHETVTL